MENNSVVKIVEAISQKTNKPYTVIIVEIAGQEVFRKFPTALELVAIKTLLK